MAKPLLKKTAQVYKNHGVRGVARKAAGYAGIRSRNLRRKAGGAPETLEEKNLREEYGLVANSIFQITSRDIERSRAATAGPGAETIRSATWFVPHYGHFGFNGIQTIFRFIEKLSQEGILNRIVIFDNPAMDVDKLKADMLEAFPGITNYEIVVFTDDKEKSLAALPESDIAFCTIWMSAYLLLRFNKTKRKYYFIQDYESLFYVAGSTYALAESTYRFGFTGVVNTPGLFEAIKRQHGLKGVSFVPSVNRELYYPDPDRVKHVEPASAHKPVRIFFYARPYNPRNAFNLGVLTIKHLLDTYGNKVEVITAGAEWNEANYGLKGRITNLGLIGSLPDVAALYRTCDIGFAYMMNKHTTYQMMEYTASGMATVMNNNEDHHWLHQDGVNCLLAEPSPAAMAEKIGVLIDDPGLRRKLLANAQEAIAQDWKHQMERLWRFVKEDQDAR